MLARWVTGQNATDGAGYQYFVTGNPHHGIVSTKPGFALMGGGADQDAAFRWMCERATRGNFVVLRASGTDAYNPYVKKLCPALDAVETLVITSREGARQQFVIETIRNADALFIAGGSQDNYVNFWQGTPVQDAINGLIARGVPIGGSSAGLAVLGQYMFSALNDTVQSNEALQNPFERRVTIGRDFIKVPHLMGKITDSHFVARNRMGRLIAFLARISRDGWTRAPYGVGIDERTAVLMDEDGRAIVTGQGAAYFLHAPGPPQQCRPNTPLTYRDISVHRLRSGPGRFNIASWTGSGGTTSYTLSAVDGVVTSSLPNNQIY
jgi:cyanophycinase